jgi:hypothetical protein
MPEAISDEMLAEMLAKALAGAPEPEMDLEKKDESPADLPNPLTEPAAAVASVKPRIELVDDGADRERIKSLVAAAVTGGKVTAATLEASIRFCSADPDGFAAWAEVAPVLSPAAGQVVKASAADRKTQTEAERLTAHYRNQRAAGRPHFTQRSA